MQAPRIEGARQGFDAQVPQQRVQFGRRFGPEHGAEAPRVAQSQQTSAPRVAVRGEREIDVIVLARRRARIDQAQASGHAEMHDQMSRAAIDEQVLAAALDRTHSRAG